jgi:hypothetical protein
LILRRINVPDLRRRAVIATTVLAALLLPLLDEGRKLVVVSHRRFHFFDH